MSCDWLGVYDDAEELILSFLWKTPGPKLDCLKKWFDDPRPKTLLVHLSNGVCRRNDNCDPAEPSDSEIVDEALEVTAFVSAYCADCDLILSPQLEDNWQADEACERAAELRSISNAEISRNPVRAENLGESVNCYDYVELHGSEREHFPTGKPCLYSNDGTDLDMGDTLWNLPDVIGREALAADIRELPDCISFVWTADGNCLSGQSKDAPLPKDRRCPLERGTIADLKEFIGSFS
jgi:hypothetical protein